MENEGSRCGSAKHRTDAPPERRVRADECSAPPYQQLAKDSAATLIPKLGPAAHASQNLRWRKAYHRGFSPLVPRSGKKRFFSCRHKILGERSHKEEQSGQFSSYLCGLFRTSGARKTESVRFPVGLSFVRNFCERVQ